MSEELKERTKGKEYEHNGEVLTGDLDDTDEGRE